MPRKKHQRVEFELTEERKAWLYELLKYNGHDRVVENMKALFAKYPELRESTKEHIAELLGLDGKTIWRNWKKLKGGKMKKIALSILLVLIMAVPAMAIELNLVPYTAVKVYGDSDNADPLFRYGVKLEADNFLWGIRAGLAIEGGKVDTRSEDMKDTCSDPDNDGVCHWPNDFINTVDKSKSYMAIFLELSRPIKLWEK